MPTERDPAATSPERTFGQNLREARHAAGMTQGYLADESDVDRSAISQYEQHHREPNLRTVLRLARVLKVEASWLLREL